MKKKQLQVGHFLLSIGLLLYNLNLVAQTPALPEMKMPDIPYKPSVTKGWVGQYVYQINFDGKSSGKSGAQEVYFSVAADCTYSGFIEFPTLVKGAIRRNQPDKYNETRWESWIRSGTSTSFSKVEVKAKSQVPYAATPTSGITGSLQKTTTFSSAGNWVKGWMSNSDLQIDHTEGKYSFAVPFVDYDLAGGTEQRIITTFSTGKKDSVTSEISSRHDFRDYIHFNTGTNWELLTGSFKEGQTEIIIRERIPFVLQQTNNGVKLSAAKGFMDFYMVLKRVG